MTEQRATYVLSNTPQRLANGGPMSAAAAGFPGCKAVPMTAAQMAVPSDGPRLEYWDAAGGVAWMVREGASVVHERPAQRLAALLDRIAEARGADIDCGGAMTFYERGPDGEHLRAMAADQAVYLDASRSRHLLTQPTVLGADAPPDLVLEVDYTTDVRRRKLREYERWRFPEVWVEVPEARSGGRRRPGLTIHVLDAKCGRYCEVKSSKALPGWMADEIHLALNEPTRSAGTWEALERVGRALRAREGAAPADDPLLRSLLRLQQMLIEHEKLLAGSEGVEGSAMVQRLLAERGIALAQDFLVEAELAAGAFSGQRKADFAAALGAAKNQLDAAKKRPESARRGPLA